MNNKTSTPRSLSAKFQTDFAYTTIKDRLPVILTKVVDQLTRDKTRIEDIYKEEGSAELKHIIGQFSKLKNEVQTDKSFHLLIDSFDDVSLWNAFLKEDEDRARFDHQKSSWFSSSWMLSECYFYRRIMSEFFSSKLFYAYDPFQQMKEDSLKNCMPTIINFASYFNSSDDYFAIIEKFLYNSLWGNRFDLSFRTSTMIIENMNAVETLSHFLLHDDFKTVIKFFKKKSSRKTIKIADFILDNTGLELVCDLFLADLLTRTNYDKVRFYVKSMPWFVSDVTATDFEFTLRTLEQSSNEILSNQAKIWRGYLANDQWLVVKNTFWTLPNDFSTMATIAPELYAQLSEARVVIIKGDLNYRKLVGDLTWPPTLPLKQAIGLFTPTNLLILRTLKSDVVVGLHPLKIPTTVDNGWMITGQYGVLQFLPHF